MTGQAIRRRQTATEAIRQDLRDEIGEEYADAHDGEYPTQEYLDEEVARRLAGQIATPESAQA